MIARGHYNETLFAAVNVEDHLVQSATSLSLQHALSATVSTLRQRLHGDAALCHVRVLMRICDASKAAKFSGVRPRSWHHTRMRQLEAFVSAQA